MSEEELSYQLLQGLKQLEMNLQLLYKTHEARGLELRNTYTTNTADQLKLEYVRQSLDGLAAASPPKSETLNIDRSKDE